MTLSIHETKVAYPEPKPLYLIEEVTANGWCILAATHSEKEAQAIYDQLSSAEVVQ